MANIAYMTPVMMKAASGGNTSATFTVKDTAMSNRRPNIQKTLSERSRRLSGLGNIVMQHLSNDQRLISGTLEFWPGWAIRMRTLMRFRPNTTN